MIGFVIQILAVGVIFFVAAFAFLNRDHFNYFAKMTIFYASIFGSAFFTCFGALANYFSNEGCMCAMRSFNFICSFWLDMTVEVRGTEKIELASGPEQKPVVIVSNHQSSLDLYVMSSMWPHKCTAMMKHSLKYIPIFNIGAILSNSIFVDRSSKENAKEALNDAIDIMRKKCLKIWMFPEGTRHHQHGFLPFRKGAFNIAVQGQFPIIPVVISDYTPFYSKPKRYFRSKGHVIVQVMDPVSTQGLTYDDVIALCDRVQKEMADVYETVSNEAEKVVQRRMNNETN